MVCSLKRRVATDEAALNEREEFLVEETMMSSDLYYGGS